MINNYIEPILRIYDSLNGITDDKEEFSNFSGIINNVVTSNDLLKGGNFFILGEPGVGKSSLLREIVSKAKIQHYFTLKINLPDFNIETLETEVIQFYSENSKLNLNFDFSNYLICLDALDEVNPDEFNRIISNIHQFQNKYPHFKVLISCRTHYINKFKSSVGQLNNFKFVVIQPFSDFQMRELLEKSLKNKEVISPLFEKTHENSGKSIIRIPRYLTVAIELANSNTITDEQIIHMPRAEMFERFIFHKLNAEKTIGAKEIFLTKRVLEKLALIMEIFQVTSISKEELITFLDETDSNINLIFLNQIDINDFIKRVLKDVVNDRIEFDNTEFQEFLAAKELLRLGEKSQVIYDLIIEPNFKHIYPNWFDVIKYTIELDPSQLLRLIEYLNLNLERQVSHDFFSLLKVVDLNKLNRKDKSSVFEIVFGYFQRHSLYVGYNFSPILASFFEISNFDLLDIGQFGEQNIYISNKLSILKEVIKNLDDSKKNEILNKITSNLSKGEDANLIANCIHVIENNGDIKILKEIEFVKAKGGEVFKSFVRACMATNQKDNYTIELLCESLTREVREVTSWINQLEEIEQIKEFLKKIALNNELLDKLASNNDYYYPKEYFNIFNIISKNWDSELEGLLVNQFNYLFPHNNFYSFCNTEYFKRLMNTLRNRSENFITLLFSFETRTLKYEIILSELVNLIDENNLHEIKSKLVNDEWIGFYTRLIYNIKQNDFNKYSKLKDKAKEINEVAVNEIENYKAEKRDETIFLMTKFREELRPDPEKDVFYDEVFRTFSSNYKVILEKATDDELDRLKKLTINVFESFTISKVNIQVLRLNEQSKTINFNNQFIPIWTLCLKTGIALGLNSELSKYRITFLELLTITHDDLNPVLNFLGEISTADCDTIARLWLNRDDDLLYYSIYNVIKIIETYKISQLLFVLKKMVLEDRLSYYEKDMIVRCICKIDVDEGYLISEFDRLISLKDDSYRKIIGTLNECLVTKYKNKNALDWRFKELRDRKFPFKRIYNKTLFGYPDNERELDTMEFARCLVELRNLDFREKFMELLTFSFLIRKDTDFIEYSYYLQRIVAGFYKELKCTGAIFQVKELIDFIECSPSEEKKSFAPLLKEIELEYVNHVLNPKNILDCIKLYNEVKRKSYLPIYDEAELLSVLKETVRLDLNNFIHNEGFSKVFSKKSSNEDFVQKTLKIQIENSLRKKGFRGIDIYREIQLQDGKRPDFIISYGFIGPIIIELKFMDNTEVKNKTERIKYMDKLENHYRKGFGAKHGIYLIIKRKEQKNYEACKKDLIREYKTLTNWHLEFISCITEAK